MKWGERHVVYVAVGDVVDTEIVVVLDVVDGVRGVVIDDEIDVVEDELVNDIDFGVIEVVYLVICVQRVIVGEWRGMLRQILMMTSLLVKRHCRCLRTLFRLSL